MVSEKELKFTHRETKINGHVFKGDNWGTRRSYGNQLYDLRLALGDKNEYRIYIQENQ